MQWSETIKKKLGKNYTDEVLEEALTKIGDGDLTIRGASRQYKISFGTLYNKYKGKHIRKPGGQPVFSTQEENVLMDEQSTTPPPSSEQSPTTGQFVLPKFSSSRRQKQIYRYVCLIQELVEPDGLMVLGLKSTGSKKKFNPVKDDISYINKNDVLEFLPITSTEHSEDVITYCFTNNIDIKEA